MTSTSTPSNTSKKPFPRVTCLAAELLANVMSADELPPVPAYEVVMLGRSNVGKSSLINHLLQRKNLARTSNTPGKTRRIHCYQMQLRIETDPPTPVEIHMIDLPGYGYAAVSKTEQAAWQTKLTRFLQEREGVTQYWVLVDSRHGIKPPDAQMLEWLFHHNKPTAVVLTKMDKLSQSERQKILKSVQGELEYTKVLPFTTTQPTCIPALWGQLFSDIV